MLLTVTIFALFASLICTFRWGGSPEKAAALVYLAMFISDPVLHLFVAPNYETFDLGHFAIDFFAWAALVAIALYSKRFWPLCVSSFQTISVVAHLAKFLDLSIHPVAYGIMQMGSSYIQFTILLIGTWQHQKRLKANGSDPSWRSSFR